MQLQLTVDGKPFKTSITVQNNKYANPPPPGQEGAFFLLQPVYSMFPTQLKRLE